MSKLLSNSILDQYELIETAIPGKYFISKFKSEDLEKLRTNAIQRDHIKRMRKMKKHFDKRLPSQFDFAVANVTTNIVGKYQGHPIEITPGADLTDGHTRREYANSVNDYPKYVSLTVYDVDNWESYKDLYYSYDATEAAERSNDKIVGACRALNIKLSSTTGLGGGFGSAIDIAYPGDRKDDILTKISYFKKEIEELDAIGLMKPTEGKMKAQVLMAAGLMALKVYGEPPETHARLIGGLQQLSQANLKTPFWGSDPDSWYGMDAIAFQFLEQGDPKDWWVEPGYLRSTKFMSIEPQMDFIWYFIDKYMSKKKVSKTKGVKPSNFVGKFEEFTETLIAIQPPAGFESTDNE